MATKTNTPETAETPVTSLKDELAAKAAEALKDGAKDAFVVESPNPGVAPSLRVDF